MFRTADNIRLVNLDSPEALCRAAAEEWLKAVIAAECHQARFSTALSGGRIAHPFFGQITDFASQRRLTERLRHVDFFWADERCVPPQDGESNFRIAEEKLFVPLRIQPEQIHRIRGELAPEAAAALASAELSSSTSHKAEHAPAVDLVILGMGEDGHVASLFPGEAPEAINRSEPYRAVVGPKPPLNRVTMGYHTLAGARQAWVLISGASKQSALRASLAPGSITPLARVLRQRTMTVIFTDLLG